MSNQISSPTDCCSVCPDVSSSQVPGPQGPAGTNGTNGTNGKNCFTTTTAQFTQPAVGSTVSVAVVDSSMFSVNEPLYVSGGAGAYTLNSIPDSTHLSLKNLGYSINAAPTTVIATSQSVVPSGVKGVDGAAGSATLNQISPTTTKGDLIVDNGANNPLASDVRVAVGSNGKALVADSTQAAGLNYTTITPNSATDKGVPRYNGASGTPVPLQTSKVVITDNGAVQASGSGGNARGTDAIDLQVSRLIASQVASGNNSAICGGKNNTASGPYSTVVAGETNTAGSVDDFVGGGNQNTANGGQSCIVGGNGNISSGPGASIVGGANSTASGLSSVVVGGGGNIASAEYSVVLGGIDGLADKHAQRAFSSGAFAANGDSQSSELLWQISTSDATAGVEMFLDGVTLRATIATNMTWGFEIIMVGRSGAGVSAVWRVTGGLQNNAGTVSLVAAVATSMLADGTSGTWGITANFVVSADNTHKALKLAVTGAGATNIRWTAHARLVEVGF